MPATANPASGPADNVVDLRSPPPSAVGTAVETAAPVTLPAAIEGRIDTLQDGRIYGWAWDRANPGHPLAVEIRVEAANGASLLLGRGIADHPREDLAGGGIGDGRHAFEIDIALPPDRDPARVVALIRSPDTGATRILTQPSAEEALLDRALAPHLQRIADAINGLRHDQRRLAAAQQGIGRLLQALQEGAAADRKDRTAAIERQDERHAALADGIRDVAERAGGLEVFLLRMDTTLRGFDATLAAKVAPSGRASIALLLAAAGGAFLATLAAGLLFR